MPRKLQTSLIKSLGLWLLFGVLAGCASALQPVEHDPALAKGLAPDSFFTEQAEQHLSADLPDTGFLLLNTGRDALTVRAALIESARQSIDAQYYIWNDDSSGRYLAGRLVAAAERGINVRLLLDDINVAGKESLFAVLNGHPHIRVRIFNPARSRSGVGRFLSLLLDFDRINRRMHNKTFVVDGYAGVAGGRNIGDEYFDEHPALNFRDRDVMALGPLVGDMTDNFEAYWNSQWSYPLEQIYQPQAPELAASARLRLINETAQAQAFKTMPPQGREAAETFLENRFAGLTQAPARLVYDVPPKDPEAPTDTPKLTAKALYELVAEAETEILVESAYFVLADDQLKEIREVVKPGLSILAITNSLASNDLVTNHSAYVRWREEMLESGIDLYELRPDAKGCKEWVGNEAACINGAVSLHSKAVVFDQSTLFVGSLNVNLRSIYLNGETVLIIQSPELAKAVADDIRYSMTPENSWHVTLDERGDLMWQSSDQQVDHEPDVGFWRRAKSRFLSWLPLEKYL
ncbi:MAG: phospholipase D family protein [Gammaproteobacteria bacterium]|nr:phospholipase D family protein [Gammaproteobacteria bacterium]